MVIPLVGHLHTAWVVGSNAGVPHAEHTLVPEAANTKRACTVFTGVCGPTHDAHSTSLDGL